jgi:DNA-binding protein H-NS
MQQDTTILLRELIEEIREQREKSTLLIQEQREKTSLIIQDIQNLKEDIGKGFHSIDNRFKNDFVSKRELLEFEQKVTYSILGILASIIVAIILDRFNNQ